MVEVIFFDSDKTLMHFAAEHPIPNCSYTFFSSSLNHTNNKKLLFYKNAEILSVFAHSDVLDTKKLDFFPNLKLIATRSTGINHIDKAYCQKRNIQIQNVPYYGAQTVAEFAFGLLLALSRHLISATQDMSHNQIHISKYTGFDLYGKTIGIVGTGSIGAHMIQLAQSFGMKILAYDLYPNKTFKKLYVPFHQLLKESDIISLHIPSTPQNYHLFNKKTFTQMKKGAYLINTARGDLIDTQALYHALQSEIIAGAGLDVLENEDILLHDDISLQDYTTNNQVLLDSALNLKLLQHPHVIATPHIAFNTTDALKRILETTFKEIQSFIQQTYQDQQ